MYLRLVREAANAARKRRVHARAHVAAVGLALPAAALRLALALNILDLAAVLRSRPGISNHPVPLLRTVYN